MEEELTLQEPRQLSTLSSAATTTNSLDITDTLCETFSDGERLFPKSVLTGSKTTLQTSAILACKPDPLEDKSSRKVETGDVGTGLPSRSVHPGSKSESELLTLTATKISDELSPSSPIMGGHRRGSSSSSSVGWMGEGERRRGSSTARTPTTPRMPSKRDSGYQTEGHSPAGHPPLPSQAPPPLSAQHFTFDTPSTSPRVSDTSSSVGAPSPLRLPSPLSPTGSPGCGAGARPSHWSRTSALTSWRRRRVLPEAADSSDDDDAFVSDCVPAGASSALFMEEREPWCAVPRPLTSRQRSRYSTGDLDDVAGFAQGVDRRSPSWLRGGDGPGPQVRKRRARHYSESSATSTTPAAAASGAAPTTAPTTATSFSLPRHGRFPLPSPSPRRHALPDSNVDGDDSEDDERRDGLDGEGVAATGYHVGPLSAVRLPGGGRIQPLTARTIATQTPHQHCQLIEQILQCPQELPQCARGSAVRRLRYYSEGEESVGASLGVVPLPDIVPVTHGYRERSMSAPDVELLQRHRQRAREVGRELRRISDEFQRTREDAGRPLGGADAQPFINLHPQANAALVALHAELNGVAAFFLSGVRRLLYRGFAGYFRYVFLWTRQAMASPGELILHPPPPPLPGSSVDDQR